MRPKRERDAQQIAGEPRPRPRSAEGLAASYAVWQTSVRILEATRPMRTALDAHPAQLDRHERNFVEKIREHGWFGTHVFADKNGPGFGYTTGFWLRFGFPELILFSLSRQVAHDTFWHMY